MKIQNIMGHGIRRSNRENRQCFRACARVSPVRMAGLTACPEVTWACARENTASNYSNNNGVVNTDRTSSAGHGSTLNYSLCGTQDNSFRILARNEE
jgi:hypothetical protein